MAVKTVQYKECTCDVCGTTATVDPAMIAPDEWQKITFSKKGLSYWTVDVCDKCITKIADYIDGLMEGDTSHETD